MKIKDLAKIDRPREKLEKYGAAKLANAELLAVLLGSGIRGLNVVELSRKIVKLIAKNGAEKIKLEDLIKEKGLGRAKGIADNCGIGIGEADESEQETGNFSTRGYLEVMRRFSRLQKGAFRGFLFGHYEYTD